MKYGKRFKFLTEMAGLIAVVASLAFVGMELRQNTLAVQSATTQAVSDQAMELTLTMATDEHLPRLVRGMIFEGMMQSDIDSEDNMRLKLAITAGLRRQENLFLQVESGVINPSALDNVSLEFYQNDYVRQFWITQRDSFDDRFVTYWDRILEASE